MMAFVPIQSNESDFPLGYLRIFLDLPHQMSS